MKTSAWLRSAASTFLAIALLAFGYCAVEWLAAKNYQASASRQFDRQLVLKEARATMPRVSAEPAAPRDGEILARLEVPRLDLSVMVVQGDGNGDLDRAAGHIPGTALPGQHGNVGLAAHRDTFFRPLKGIHANDEITLRSLAGTWKYHVISTEVVNPKDVSVLDPDGKDTLTLVTCYPFNYVGSAPKRFIVKAER